MTVGHWLEQSAAKLAKAGLGNPRLDCLLILEVTTQQSRSHWLAHLDDQLPKIDQADALLARRLKRQPMAQLTGRCEFYGLELLITPDVLVPRVETEKIVELAIKLAPPDSRLLDLGTGSGALALAIKQHRSDLQIIASDISPAVLAVAKRNAKLLKLDMEFVQSDLWEGLLAQFQTVVTNLPYLSDQAMADLMTDAKYEPKIALYGGPDGLDLYRRMLADLPRHLASGGHLITECDPWQQAQLSMEAAKHGLSVVEKDYFVMAFRRC